jgi:two-component system, OmpR family, sensor kinase
MKLLQKTNRYYLLFTAIFLLIAGVFLYFMMTSMLNEETTEKLLANKIRITKQIERGKEITQLPPVIEVKQLNSLRKMQLTIKDTILFDPIEGEPELFREIRSVETINKKTYLITLRQVILQADDYYNTIGLTIAIAMLLLLLGLLFINRGISRKLWSPFYQNLESLKSFSLRDEKALDLQPSNITEFRELNLAIQNLTEKVRLDYQSQKQFSENASHEIQTPLAIIRTKMEILIQSENFSQDQTKLMQDIYESANRLSKLNQSLLLITKIENRQFSRLESISLRQMLETQLEHFEEFIQVKNLTINRQLQTDVQLEADPVLIGILLSNLLGNAIKHNINGGTITIELQNNRLTISNTGNPLNIPAEKLFGRFQKAGTSTDSIGLGLSIVKQICDSYAIDLSYSCTDRVHTLSLVFKNDRA